MLVRCCGMVNVNESAWMLAVEHRRFIPWLSRSRGGNGVCTGAFSRRTHEAKCRNFFSQLRSIKLNHDLARVRPGSGAKPATRKGSRSRAVWVVRSVNLLSEENRPGSLAYTQYHARP